MTGETDLDTLIRSMEPRLVDDVYVFVTLPDGPVPPDLDPVMTFQEAEGTTLILLRSTAEAHGLYHVFPCRMITLDVHSALDAVGFLARITTALALVGMGVNPVSGFYHDHIFVPDGRETDAMDILHALALGNRQH